MQENTAPTVDESYASATNAQSLAVTHSEGPRCAVDLLAAAAWSPSRLGLALLRLHSEWDGAEHPRPGTKLYMHEFAILLGKLKSLPEVRHQLTLQAEKWGIEDAESVAVATIRWWLDHICQACGGTKFQTVQGTNRHSAKVCGICHGSGETKLPYGRAGQRLLEHIQYCLRVARVSVKARLKR